MKDSQIKAVHQRDFKKLLTSLGVYDAVCSRTITCYFCHDTVEKDTISAVFPFNGRICFCCDKKDCYTALLDMTKDGDAGE